MTHSTSSFPEFPGLTSLTSAMVSTGLKKAELRVAEVKFLVKLRIFNENSLALGSVENEECGVWKMRGVENAECGKCVENFNFPSHFVIPMWISNV